MRMYDALVDLDKADCRSVFITDSRDVPELRLVFGLTMEQPAEPSERKIETGNQQPHLIFLLCVLL